MSPARQAVPGPAAPDPPPGLPRSGCWRVRHCPEKTRAVITLPPSLPAQAFALPGHMAAGRMGGISQAVSAETSCHAACRTLAHALLVAQGDLVGLGDVVGLDGPESCAQALAGLPQQLEGVGGGASRGGTLRTSPVFLDEVGLQGCG